MIADMCKYGFNLWLDSLRDNIWPNMVYAIHQILGDRLCSRSEDRNHGTLWTCQLCGTQTSYDYGLIQHNLFQCEALNIKSSHGCTFEGDRWSKLQANPFHLMRGHTPIVEIMNFYATLLKYIEKNSRPVGVIERSRLVMASKVQDETAESARRREYKKQRRSVDRGYGFVAAEQT